MEGGNTSRLEEILDKLTHKRRNGAGWVARCPAHDDREPSLSVNEAAGRILFYCHAGCTYEQIKEALGIEDFSTEIAAYDYRDENGALLYQVVRCFPKTFLMRRPDGSYGVRGVRRVPYHLPEIIKANPVVVCEGEKDCDTAARLGFVATCNTGGAGKGKWRDEHAEFLRGKIVFVIADADAPGREHAERIALSVLGKAAAVRVLEMPGAKDLTEWVERGGTREKLTTLFAEAKDWQPTAPPEEIEITTTLASEIAPELMAWRWPNRIPDGKLTIFCGPPDTGKSATVLDIVARGSRGSAWPDCENTGGAFATLMLVSEDDLSDVVVPRLMAADAELRSVAFAKKSVIRNGAKAYEREIALDTDLAAIERILEKNPNIKMVVLDPLTGYFGKLKANTEEEMRGLLIKLKELAERRGVAVLGIAHFNKKIEQAAIHRLAGAGALAAVPRAVWAFVKDQDDPEKLNRLMLNAKLNVVAEAKKTGLAYRIEERMIAINGGYGGAPRIAWGAASSGDLDEMLHRSADPERGKLDGAKKWLSKALAFEAKFSRDIFASAEEEGYSANTIRRAGKALGVDNVKTKGGWQMRLGTEEVV